MKRLIILFFCIFTVYNTGYSQDHKVWGIWNLGTRENSWKVNMPDGSYFESQDGRSLLFQSDYHGNGPRITFNGGGYYKILEMISTISDESTVSFYIADMTSSRKNYSKAKLVMHYIDGDHMWLEVVRDDICYPTDVLFDDYLFKGQAFIFWREEVPMHYQK
jgi:hypothetical protein